MERRRRWLGWSAGGRGADATETGTLDPAPPDVVVQAYLDTDDDEVARKALDALDALAELLGYDRPVDEEIERGSIWRRAKARLRSAVTSEEARHSRIKIERALELAMIDQRQAEVDSKASQAVATLVASVADVPQACMHVRSILLIKFVDPQGPVLLTRSLSQVEIAALERCPEILRNPRTALQALGQAVDSLDDLDNGHL